MLGGRRCGLVRRDAVFITVRWCNPPQVMHDCPSPLIVHNCTCMHPPVGWLTGAGPGVTVWLSARQAVSCGIINCLFKYDIGDFDDATELRPPLQRMFVTTPSSQPPPAKAAAGLQGTEGRLVTLAAARRPAKAEYELRGNRPPPDAVAPEPSGTNADEEAKAKRRCDTCTYNTITSAAS
jgi:hypothetical protein